MGKELKLRGPDDQSFQHNDRMGFVHRRLAIIDLDPRSNQPMESDDWILCYNGEIYNFREIKSRIGQKFNFKTQSDSEVLLAGLQVLGLEETLRVCAGMFAFLAFNKREKSMYAVRDPLGIKPLLMTQTEDGGFCFASSVAALVRALPKRQWRVDSHAMGSFFALGAVSNGGSVYEGIERVAPAEYVCITADGKLKRKTYWTPSYQPDFSMENLVDVVREYQNADVKSALFLSGGVDSTFLAAATKNLDCFHLTSPERGYAAEVAKRLGRRFVEVRPDTTDYVADMEKVIRFHGEPMMSCGIPFVVAKQVRAEGYKMAISANGADELFHGYYRTPCPEWKLNQLPVHEVPSYKWFAKQVAHIFRDSRRIKLDEKFARMSSLKEIGLSALACHNLPDFPASSSYRWFELMSYVLHDLNPTLDAASMANSLEMRVPFLDHRIVQGVLSWDANRLITPAHGRKAPMKEYLEPWFPAAFFNRDKLGFSIHKSSLGEIAGLGHDALMRYKKSGRLSVSASTVTNGFERDIIYIGNSCFAHNLWEGCGLAQ